MFRLINFLEGTVGSEEEIIEAIDTSGGSFRNILQASATQIQLTVNIILGLALAIVILLRLVQFLESKRFLYIVIGIVAAGIAINVVIQVFLK